MKLCFALRLPGWLLLGLLPFSLAVPPLHAQQTAGATFGDVVALGGTPSDAVLDEPRHSLYLVNNNSNRVDVFDYNANVVVNSIPVGQTPLAAAISMDGAWLYVTNNGSSTLSVIDLRSGQSVQTVPLPSKPEGVEVGVDGRVLVSMIGSGVVGGVPVGTLAVFDPSLQQGQQVLPVSVPALPSTPAPLPAQTLNRPVTTFRGKLLRTPDGQFIVGVITPTNATTYIFVYESASGIVLRNRTVSGQSSVLSMSPDGSRFMTGMTLYDTATLNVAAQQNNANAPFAFTSAVNTLQNVGGSAFSPDGTTIYSAFNVAATATPAPRPQSSTLLINDARNLGIRLGIKLPESIVAKLVVTGDGTRAWGMSESGLVSLPLGNLFDYPIIAPETTQVFLAMDECNRGIATGTLHVNNLGKGRLTFTAVNNTGSALIVGQSSGLAPATLTFTMDPGRSGVVRQPGTNIWTGAGTSQGTAFNVTLSSAEAINLPNTIRVYMNYRQRDQRGIVYPVPTTPNSNSANNTSTANPSGNEGLQDLLLDEPRGKLYVANSGYNRLEVFDLKKQRFTDPIVVGQLPHQMAMTSDGNTLYVANTGGESISIVDLNLGRVVDNVVFPPIPRNGTAAVINPVTLASGLFGLQFLMSNGSQWKLVGNQATVRPADSVTPVLLTGPVYSMIATPGSEYILTLAGNGQGYLYNATADAYTAGRLLFTAPIQGYYGTLGAGASGNYFLANGLILNSSMTVIGGAERPGATTTTTPLPGQPPTQTLVNNGQRNVAAVAPLNETTFLRLTTPVRQNITATTRDDARTTLEIIDMVSGNETLAGVVPENPVMNVFSTQRFNTTSRQLVVDSQGTAYAITLSGLSVISLAPSGGNTRPQISSGRAIANSVDGTAIVKPGSFITVTGANLASTAVADTIPVPTVLGGSCVTFGDVAAPLLETSSGRILAQVPDTLRSGVQVVQVRSLATAQASDPVLITLSASTTPPSTPDPGPVATDPGVTTTDPGATATDPGATTTDPGAAPPDPGTPPDPGAAQDGGQQDPPPQPGTE